jgi:hypothetical protein
MKTALKVIAVGIVLLAAGVISLNIFNRTQRSKYDATAVPFIEKTVPEITAEWDPAVAKRYMIPQATVSGDQDLAKLFAYFSKLGKLQSMETPRFVSLLVDANTGTIITYAAPAKFTAGAATITVRLLSVGDGFQIYLFHIDSFALIHGENGA